MLIFIQELNSTDLAWPISLGWWDHSPERYGCRPVRKQMSAIDTTHWYFIPFIIYLIHTPGQLRFCYCELCTNIFINKVCLRITGETPLPGDMITASSLLQEEDCLNNVWGFFFFFPSPGLCLESFLSSDKKHFESFLDHQLRASFSLMASSPRQSLPGVQHESSLQDEEKLTKRLSAWVLALLAQCMVTPHTASHGTLWLFCSRNPLFLTQPCHLCAEDFTNKFSSITVEGDRRKQSRKNKKKMIVPFIITKAPNRTVQRLIMWI